MLQIDNKIFVISKSKKPENRKHFAIDLEVNLTYSDEAIYISIHFMGIFLCFL